ncbi:MAG: DNA internalization-related competence protein ComEC/Rec2, partial [Enterobacteriaceae bacterium]
YDTGNAWPGGSMAQLEILPYLRWRGLIVDSIIISHQHQDHVGGLSELLAVWPRSQVITSSSSIAGQTCIQGRQWRWQGLQLEVLWPPRPVPHAVNPDSCTVRITDGQHTLLLTGDLELAQEKQLVATLRHKLTSTILQVPHHGSQTSSSSLLLRTVQPQLALNSTARYNPWNLPAKKVTERYQKQRIRWYSTAQEGQLTLLFYRQHWKLERFRQDVQKRWYHAWFGLTDNTR